MYPLFSSIKNLTTLDKVCIDNNIFRLHYKFTVIVILAFSILVTSKQYIGDPIDCISGNKAIAQHVMDTFCWIFSTYTVPSRTGVIGTDVLAMGVSSDAVRDDEIKYHKYYQWVCFTLLFQAILFYIPRYLWKSWEGRKMQTIMLDLGNPVVTNPNDTKNSCILLTDYFMKNMYLQNYYVYRFFLCEIINFVNVIGQIYFIDYFLDGQFLTYGIEVVKLSEMDQDERTDPMSRIFPRLTKCTFHKYGPSGGMEKIDALCVLSLNIVNEKIYIFLWFWFVMLALLSGLILIYRICIITGSKKIRILLLYTRARLSTRDEIRVITNKFAIGDWFILYQLSKNIDPVIFSYVITELASRLKTTKNDNNYQLQSVTVT